MADTRFELGSGAEEMFTTSPGVDFSDVPGDPLGQEIFFCL